MNDERIGKGGQRIEKKGLEWKKNLELLSVVEVRAVSYTHLTLPTTSRV